MHAPHAARGRVKEVAVPSGPLEPGWRECRIRRRVTGLGDVRVHHVGRRVGRLAPAEGSTHVRGMPSAEPKRPASWSQVWRLVRLETFNLLAEYGSLVIFTAGAVSLEAVRQKFVMPEAANLALFVAEAVTAFTMIVPKAIRAVGDVLQTLAITAHDVAYALRHGARRPAIAPGEVALALRSGTRRPDPESV
jgi:hypothetical protein